MEDKYLDSLIQTTYDKIISCKNKYEILKIINDTIVNYICEKIAIKLVQIVSDLVYLLAMINKNIINYNNDLNIDLTDFNIVDLINNLIKENKIVEIEYIVPDMNYRIKSILLPANTKIIGTNAIIEIEKK